MRIPLSSLCRMRCRWVKEDMPSLVPSPTVTSTPLLPQTPPTATPPPDTQSGQQRELRSINDKV